MDRLSSFFAHPTGGPSSLKALAASAPAIMRRHMRYEAHDLEATRRHLQSQHPSIRLDLTDDAGFVSYREAILPLGGLMLSMGCVNATRGYELAFQSRDEYLVSIPLRGEGWVASGEISTELDFDHVMVTAPACSVLKHWDGPGEVLTLHIPTAQFDWIRGNSDAGGDAVSPPIAMVAAENLSGFLRLLDLICREIDDPPANVRSGLLQGGAVEGLNDALLALLGAAVFKGERQAPEARSVSPAIPYYVRRAEEFISANVQRDITLDELAAAAGVSTRSLQYGFRRYRDTTPMLFLKRLRHERARALLRADSGPRRRVCEVASEIGYTNSSQFSRDYRAMFGESPSQTAAMPRALVPVPV